MNDSVDSETTATVPVLVVTEQIEGSSVVGLLYGLWGALGIVLNIVVTQGLQQCDQLSYSTRALMKSICITNTIGLLPKTLFSPYAAFKVRHLYMEFEKAMPYLSLVAFKKGIIGAPSAN